MCSAFNDARRATRAAHEPCRPYRTRGARSSLRSGKPPSDEGTRRTARPANPLSWHGLLATCQPLIRKTAASRYTRPRPPSLLNASHVALELFSYGFPYYVPRGHVYYRDCVTDSQCSDKHTQAMHDVAEDHPSMVRPISLLRLSLLRLLDSNFPEEEPMAMIIPPVEIP